MPVAVKFVDKSMASTVALSREVELLQVRAFAPRHLHRSCSPRRPVQRIGNHEDIINLVEVFETEDGLQLVLELCVAALRDPALDAGSQPPYPSPQRVGW